MTRQIILDTETTGLNPLAADNPDRLIEFAGLEMINRQFTGNNLHLYVHPERDIPDEVIAVHGITLEQLEGKPIFAEVGQQIADFLRDAELIIHNAKFDLGFLDAEFARIGLPATKSICANVIDTLQIARDRYPGQKNSLDALCNRLDVDRSKRVLHGALIDCELLGEVYLALTRKQGNLLDAFAEENNDTPTDSNHTFFNTPITQLTVLHANEEEQAAHLAYLDGLDKSAPQGCCLYRRDKQTLDAAYAEQNSAINETETEEDDQEEDLMLPEEFEV